MGGREGEANVVTVISLAERGGRAFLPEESIS
jgi:hypothetical protein